MTVVGEYYVTGNVHEDVPGSEMSGSALIGVEFLNAEGTVINGPFFGVADAQGHYLIFIDPVCRSEWDHLNAKVIVYNGTFVEKTWYHFLSYHGLDPQNNL